ncbi:chromosome partitioning protein ParB [Agromyces humatus]|uniref:Chromosome partitioning protein ParB n=1 Tax=Agromyces humatus TaxID=279573 RepID=A0ABP4X8D2_9MICO
MSSGLTAGRPSRTGSNPAKTLSILAGDEKPARVNFELAPAKHRALKAYAASQGKTIKELLTDYIDQLPLDV